MTHFNYYIFSAKGNSVHGSDGGITAILIVVLNESEAIFNITRKHIAETLKTIQQIFFCYLATDVSYIQPVIRH